MVFAIQWWVTLSAALYLAADVLTISISIAERNGNFAVPLLLGVACAIGPLLILAGAWGFRALGRNARGAGLALMILGFCRFFRLPPSCFRSSWSASSLSGLGKSGETDFRWT
jgi:hypothetical protein